MNETLHKLQEKKKDAKGFTLIELLIVIVILGILAGVVVFSVEGIQNRGKTSACSSDVSTVTTAAEAYYAQNGNYPADTATLVSSGFLHTAPPSTEMTYTPTGTAPNYTGFTAKGTASTTSADGC
jgi:general secretion pathway protein G